MNSINAQNLLNQIDTTVINVQFLSSKHTDPLLDGMLAKYLTVYISGIYEEIVETILNDYVDSLGSAPVSSYVSERLNHTFMNPKPGAIEKLLGYFDSAWEATLATFDPVKRRALNSIVTNKNSIAHGQACAVTLADVMTDYNLSRDYIVQVDHLVV